MAASQCQEEDCECKMGLLQDLEVYKVVDNDNEGDYFYVCKNAIKEYNKSEKCLICNNFMKGSCLVFPEDDGMICVRCFHPKHSSDFYDFLMSRWKENPCVLFEVFEDDFLSPHTADIFKIDCKSCGKVHRLMDPEKDGFQIMDDRRVLVDLDGTLNSLVALTRIFYGTLYRIVMLWFFQTEWVNFKMTRIAEQKHEALCHQEGKRLIRTFLPDATDEVAEILLRKKQRFENPPREKDVLTFIKWLNE